MTRTSRPSLSSEDAIMSPKLRRYQMPLSEPQNPVRSGRTRTMAPSR